MHLLRDSPVPLYQQLVNEIRSRIETGEWRALTRLPTEEELGGQLGVSRVTVRQALAAAADAGLLTRVPGKGTFVARIESLPGQTGPSSSTEVLNVGYVVPHLSSSFNVQTLLGVESVFRAEGYQLTFCNSEGELAEEDRVVERLAAQGIGGCVVQPIYGEVTGRALVRLVESGCPIVMVDRDMPGLQADLVTADHFQGGYAVVQHLLEAGYRDLVYLARQPLQMSSIAERLRGYQAAMINAGLGPRPPFVVDGSIELGYIQSQSTLTVPEAPAIATIATFLRGRERPEAVVAMNDLHALLVLRAAQEVGLAVPGDLAVVGYDDLDFAAVLSPPLTTVAQQPFQMGVEAARLLVSRIRGERGSPKQIRLPARLVVRASSQRTTLQARTEAGTSRPKRAGRSIRKKVGPEKQEG